MMMQQTAEPESLPRDGTGIPATIESPCAKLVYLYLTTHGPATVTELQDGLELKKLTLFSVLRTLRERGLVREDGARYIHT